jgi:hypothetical protein
MSLVALHVFALALLGQPATLPATGAGPVDIYQVSREVMILAQLAPLRLTQKQVQSLVDLYRESGRLASPDSTTAAQLTDVRQRLLSGAVVSDKEIQALLAALPQEVRRGGFFRGGRGGRQGDDMLAKATDILTDWQQALLVNRGETLQQIIVRRAAPPTAQTANVLIPITAIPAAEWPAKRATLAERIGSAVGGDKGDQVRQALPDFLDRVHGMTETQIRAKAGELWQSLAALVPPEVPVLGLLQGVDANNLRRRAGPLLLDPLTPAILLEMAQVRGWKLQ